VPTRRSFLQQSLSSFAVYALLRETRLRAAPARSSDVAHWLRRQEDMATALAHGTLRPVQWQDEVERLAREIDVDALRDAIGHADLRDDGRGSASDPFRRSIAFRDEDGRRRRFRYATALFAFDRDNVITPHGHRHMASAHMVLEGSLRVRNFDRLRDEGHSMVLRPTVDAIVRAGDISTMSSERNNVHWFVPVSAKAATFDVIVTDLDHGQPAYAIEPVDPLRGKRLDDGSLLAPIIDFDASSRLYTRDV
jgi:hypothetical protein